jgi:bacillithiol system protein YtxJ
MNWISLTTEMQLKQVIENSYQQAQVIFKHSTTCSISKVALRRLETAEAPEGYNFYYLDLLSFRPISNLVASLLKVHHESPQVLIIKNGECIYDESHMAIQMDDIKEQLA